MKKIIFENVSLSFGNREIFKNVSLELLNKKIIGVVGANGSGKSTFLKLAAKIIKPDNGDIKIFGCDTFPEVAAITPELKIYDALTAEENLKFFAKLRGKNLTEENIFEFFERVGLDKNFITVRAGNFSTGMRQRLKFAILLCVDAEFWILDEVTANLDEDGKNIFMREIRRGVEAGKFILLATNDKFDMEFCDELFKLPIV